MDLSTNNSAYSHMFYDCYSLRDAIELPASGVASFAYYNMFLSCNSMSGIVDIAATSFASGALYSMFWNNNNSQDFGIRVHFNEWPIDPDPWANTKGSHSNWFNMNGYASNIFYCPEALPEERGGDRIPQKWTIVRE